MSKKAKGTLTVLEKSGPNDLIAAGEVVEMRMVDAKGRVKGLELRAQKLLHMLVDNAGKDLVVQNAKHRVRVAELNDFMHINGKEIHAHIVELAGTVIAADVTIDGRKAREYGALVSSATHFYEGDQEIEYKFSDLMIKVFQSSTHWAALNTRAMHAFQSSYGLRLYEMITLRQGRNQYQETFDLTDLRQRLGVPDGKLIRWPDLRRKALEKACDEVNALSGAKVTWEPKKRGRTVVGVTLTWKVKDKIELAETDKRLNQPKIQRKGAIKGAHQREKAVLKAKTAALAASMPTEQTDFLDDEIPY